jgi:hypothetical protein
VSYFEIFENSILTLFQKETRPTRTIHINGDLALTMGKVILTDQNGKTTTVDKTWGFKKDDQGRLRIVLHHSSLPYSP